MNLLLNTITRICMYSMDEEHELKMALKELEDDVEKFNKSRREYNKLNSDRCEYCGVKIIGNHTHCVSCGAPL